MTGRFYYVTGVTNDNLAHCTRKIVTIAPGWIFNYSILAITDKIIINA
jgi:hypothetical protein